MMLWDELLLIVWCTLLLGLCMIVIGFGLAECAHLYEVLVARRRRTAQQKSDILLNEWLSPSQLIQYRHHGTFDVTGCHSGKRYRIRCERQMNVDEYDETGRRTAVWCFGPEGDLPLGDILLPTPWRALTNFTRPRS
jgi:hypothetical protein